MTSTFRLQTDGRVIARKGVASSITSKTTGAGLRVLTSGPMPPDTGEFVASDRVKAILTDLEHDADVVLIDAPPMLTVNDALALSPLAGGIFMVARIGVVRRPMFKHLKRMLERCPARVLGCVVIGGTTTHGYGYQYGYGYSSTNETLETPADLKAALYRRASSGYQRLENRLPTYVSAGPSGVGLANRGRTLDQWATRGCRRDRGRRRSRFLSGAVVERRSRRYRRASHRRDRCVRPKGTRCFFASRSDLPLQRGDVRGRCAVLLQ